MKRIDHLLDAEEMEPGTGDLRLQEGCLEVRELVVSWETMESAGHFRRRERLSGEENGGEEQGERERERGKEKEKGSN